LIGQTVASFSHNVEVYATRNLSLAWTRNEYHRHLFLKTEYALHTKLLFYWSLAGQNGESVRQYIDESWTVANPCLF